MKSAKLKMMTDVNNMKLPIFFHSSFLNNNNNDIFKMADPLTECSQEEQLYRIRSFLSGDGEGY